MSTVVNQAKNLSFQTHQVVSDFSKNQKIENESEFYLLNKF
jgi:hypothetical protein